MTRLTLLLALLAPTVIAGETERLEEDIGSLRFLNGLQLSRDQVLFLLPIAERGAFLRREFEGERDALYVKFYDALVRFKEEDLRNEGLSPAVMGAAGGTSHAFKVLGNRVATAMAPLEQQAAAGLTPAQRKVALPRFEDRHPLDLLRALKGSDFGELRDTLARSLANQRVRAGLISRYERREERLRIRTLLHRLRKWEDGEYQARREELLRSLVPGRERTQVATEIRRIYQARYGRAGPLAQHLFREAMLPVLAERVGIDTPELPKPDGSGRTVTANLDEVKRKVAELKADINLLNLMNGLHLDTEQLEVIAKAAKTCVPEKLPAKRRAEARTRAALREVYDALRRDEPVPASALVRLQSPEAKRGAGYVRARQRDLAEARAAGVEELLEVLTPEQGEVIRTYNPCLVPPQNLRDPVRAGQANDSEPLERVVDQLRSLPLDRDAANRFLERIEATEGRVPAKEREAVVRAVLHVATKAQALDQIGYVAQRQALAEHLKPAFRLHTLKERLLQLDGADKVIRYKVAAFLLDPRIVPLVNDRLSRIENPTPRARPDIPKAEICEDGECGKP